MNCLVGELGEGGQVGDRSGENGRGGREGKGRGEDDRYLEDVSFWGRLE